MLVNKEKRIGNRISAVLFTALLIAAFFVSGSWLKRKMPNDIFVFLNKPSDFLKNLGRLVSVVISPGAILNDNETLRQKNISLETQLAQLETVEADNEFLRSQLSLARSRQAKFVSASIVGYEIFPTYHFAFVNVGSEQGVRNGAAVVGQAGALIGRIANLGSERSLVLLISDPKSRIAATTAKKISAVVVGQLSGELLLDLAPLNQQLAVGDIVVSSGIDGLYPPDLPIGKISRTITKETDAYQRALVEPLVNPRDARLVLVIQD